MSKEQLARAEALLRHHDLRLDIIGHRCTCGERFANPAHWVRHIQTIARAEPN